MGTWSVSPSAGVTDNGNGSFTFPKNDELTLIGDDGLKIYTVTYSGDDGCTATTKVTVPKCNNDIGGGGDLPNPTGGSTTYCVTTLPLTNSQLINLSWGNYSHGYALTINNTNTPSPIEVGNGLVNGIWWAATKGILHDNGVAYYCITFNGNAYSKLGFQPEVYEKTYNGVTYKVNCK